MPPASKLDTNIKVEIYRAPKRLWSEISRAVEEQEWTCEEIREKVKRINTEPDRAQETIQPVRTEVLEAPADKLIPLLQKDAPVGINQY